MNLIFLILKQCMNDYHLLHIKYLSSIFLKFQLNLQMPSNVNLLNAAQDIEY